MLESFNQPINNNEGHERKFRAFLDYINELGRFSEAVNPEYAKKRWFGGLKCPSFKDGTLALKTLDDRFESGIRKFNGDVRDYYIMHSALETDEDKEIFFKKREQLNGLVAKFNEELRKDDADARVIQVLYTEIEKLIGH